MYHTHGVSQHPTTNMQVLVYSVSHLHVCQYERRKTAVQSAHQLFHTDVVASCRRPLQLHYLSRFNPFILCVYAGTVVTINVELASSNHTDKAIISKELTLTCTVQSILC